MAKFIPVEPEKWAEMVKAAAASDYWRIEAETDHARWLRTLEENEKLRAEVERLTKLCQATSPDGFIHIRDINAAKEGKQS